MNKFDHLIGKTIIHKTTGKKFIVNTLDNGYNSGCTVYGRNITMLSGETGHNEGYVFGNDFDQYFTVLNDKITNWRKELE